MDRPAAMQPNRPQSVKEIVESAMNFDFNVNIPFKHWTRAADTLWQEASFALRDSDYRRAYMMLYRFSNLVVELLPTHPAARTSESRQLYRGVVSRVGKAVELLEQLKPPINKEYEEWQRMNRDSTKAQDTAADSTLSAYQRFAARDPSLSGNTKILDAGEHRDLAVDLAQREFRRRDAARRATRQAGVSEEVEQERRKAGSWEDWDVHAQRNGAARTTANEDDDLRRQMEAARRRLTADERRNDDTNQRIVGSLNQIPPRASRTPSNNYSYPTIAKSQPVKYDATPVVTRREQPHPQPLRPPKEDFAPPAPPAPPKYESSSYLPTPPEPLYQPESALGPPVPDRPPQLPPKEESAPFSEGTVSQAKAQRLTFKPATYLENGDPVRPVFLPHKLRSVFLDIAEENTRRGVEMCGMLCGTPVNNALFVTCLVIPEQKCTSDTCETENESAILDYCTDEDLLVLGWIHTHPTQTCFMSSRDLHTQAGYQVMMPESIAIVCAPTKTPSYGIFRLTNGPGLKHILQCSQSATFHQHSLDNLYTNCEHPPGHVFETDSLEFIVHDLRPGKGS